MSLSKQHASHTILKAAADAARELGSSHPRTAEAIGTLSAAVVAQGEHVHEGWAADYQRLMHGGKHGAKKRKGKH